MKLKALLFMKMVHLLSALAEFQTKELSLILLSLLRSLVAILSIAVRWMFQSMMAMRGELRFLEKILLAAEIF